MAPCFEKYCVRPRLTFNLSTDKRKLKYDSATGEVSKSTFNYLCLPIKAARTLWASVIESMRDPGIDNLSRVDLGIFSCCYNV